MKYVYASRSGKTEKLVQDLGLEGIKINDGSEVIGEDFILFTYTDGHGIVPPTVVDFLKNNGANIKGVVATGNLERHGDTYCFAGDIIAKEYNVPCYGKIDGAGGKDVNAKLKADLGL